MKNVIITLTALFFTFGGFAQEAAKAKSQTIQFKTSAICDMCKDRIEEKLNYTKGVVYAEQNLETKVLTVKYKTKTISAEEIYKIVSLTGYKAGDLERDTAAFKKLPKCCREVGFCEEK